MAQNTYLVPQQCNGAGRVALTGRFLSGTHNKDYASYILPVTAAGKDLMVYSNTKGTG